MVYLLGATFIITTALCWWCLRALTGRREIVDNRLSRYSTGYTRPMSVNEDGEVVAASARIPPLHTTVRSTPPRLLDRLLAKSKQKKRQAAFLKQIIEALTLISSSMKAGYSFLQSMEMVAKEVPAPLGEEFGRAVHEMSLGATVEESLEEMVRRVGLADLQLVVTAVLVQRQVGGNLAEVLDTIAQTIRERIRIQGEIKTLTAQGRISGWVVGCLPIGLTLIISALNPKYMGVLLTNPVGWLLLGFGLCSQIVGMLIIRKIVRIEV